MTMAPLESAGSPDAASADAASADAASADAASADAGSPDAATQRLVTVHSLTWLAVGNGVGLLLATLLLFPRLGALLGPFTYGRLMPLHLDLQLYGWSSLPLVGLLLRLYLPGSGLDRAPRLAVGLWSGGLAFGAVSWLAGTVGGKLFLSWAGAARALFAGAMLFLALVLAAAFMRQRARRPGPWLAAVGKGALLIALLAVPFVLYWSASPEVYPPINPDSGGATGGSLMGSTLGIVVIIFLCPLFLGMRPTAPAAEGSGDRWRTTRTTAVILALHFAWFGLLDHGDRSNHEPLQVVSLASLAIWLPLLIRHLRRFRWPAASRRWLVAFGVWGGLLLLTGVVDFLPGVLERFKFTNALVAHAHVAMAGMITCLHAVILTVLDPGAARRAFADRRGFVLWQVGAGVLVASLLVLGVLEGVDPTLLFHPSAAVTALYAVRWAGGALMLLASVRWLGRALSAAVERAVVAPPASVATSATSTNELEEATPCAA
jgi:cytochrome c oxidase cbb3-type subunit 1